MQRQMRFHLRRILQTQQVVLLLLYNRIGFAAFGLGLKLTHFRVWLEFGEFSKLTSATKPRLFSLFAEFDVSLTSSEIFYLMPNSGISPAKLPNLFLFIPLPFADFGMSLKNSPSSPDSGQNEAPFELGLSLKVTLKI